MLGWFGFCGLWDCLFLGVSMKITAPVKVGFASGSIILRSNNVSNI